MAESWQGYSKKNGIELNNQYFLIYCQSIDGSYHYMEYLRNHYDFKDIKAHASTPLGPWIYANLNTRFMFQGNIGIDLLSGGPTIGDHAITMDEFNTILEIYEKYKGLKVLQFN